VKKKFLPPKESDTLKMPVYNPAMPYIMYHHFSLIPEDLVDDAILPGPNPVIIFCPADFYTVPGNWIFCKRFSFFQERRNKFTCNFL